MQRLSLLLIPGLIAIALFAGIGGFDRATAPASPEQDTASLDFDAYSEGISSVLYDEFGNISYTLQAVRQTHYIDDSTVFDEPLISLFQEGSSRWDIVADSGNISATSGTAPNAEQIINLVGQVEVHSRDEFGNTMLITTDYLTLNPQLESLETEDNVKMVTENLEQTSIGMFADLNREVRKSVV